jgi:glucosyl-dolichyl phosphate glucuronosyltransferase
MKASVIVCTHNRSQSLTNVLESLAAQTFPDADGWEVIVVDNNSRDHTAQVVADFASRYPNRFRYCFESQQGLSNARNAGIREARGDVIAFTDDDTTVSPNWLYSLTKSLHDGEWAGAGGRILPDWTCPRPRWLNLEGDYASGPLVLFDLGFKAKELKQPPFGANMAFRKEMFGIYGLFRTDLGRQPHNLMSNEESEFTIRLLVKGERLRYEPEALVYHPVLENRLQKTYFLKWWFDKGRGEIRIDGIHNNSGRRISGIPIYNLFRLMRWIFAWLTSVDECRRFSCKITVWSFMGEICEYYQQHISHKRNNQNGSGVSRG